MLRAARVAVSAASFLLSSSIVHASAARSSRASEWKRSRVACSAGRHACGTRCNLQPHACTKHTYALAERHAPVACMTHYMSSPGELIPQQRTQFSGMPRPTEGVVSGPAVPAVVHMCKTIQNRTPKRHLPSAAVMPTVVMC